jgi:hypothetical protein
MVKYNSQVFIGHRMVVYHFHLSQNQQISAEQVCQISKHRHVPDRLRHLEAEKKEMIHSRKRKEGNRRAHSKPGTVPIVPETQKNVVRIDR